MLIMQTRIYIYEKIKIMEIVDKDLIGPSVGSRFYFVNPFNQFSHAWCFIYTILLQKWIMTKMVLQIL